MGSSGTWAVYACDLRWMACFERICRTTDIAAPLFSPLRFGADFELLGRITTGMLTGLLVQALKGPQVATRHIDILAWLFPDREKSPETV